jgi:hypothetical protein
MLPPFSIVFQPPAVTDTAKSFSILPRELIAFIWRRYRPNFTHTGPVKWRPAVRGYNEKSFSHSSP